MAKQLKHISVMAKEVIKFLHPRKGQIFVDATLGLGGHASLILQKISPTGRLFAFEFDPSNAQKAKKNLTKWKNCLTIIKKNFEDLRESLVGYGIDAVDGILYDLGISSAQLDDAQRGFSFRLDGPLDMRISSEECLTAGQIVNQFSEHDLTVIFKRYGEEPKARMIARAIVKQRLQKPLCTTQELSDLIAANKRVKRWGGGHPATQVFQALRIAVNKELEKLEISLKSALDIVKPNGSIAVISFHSLEDRIVKKIFKEASKSCICPKLIPICVCGGKPKFKIITKKPIYPDQEEVDSNPRSRSAKLRVITRIF